MENLEKIKKSLLLTHKKLVSELLTDCDYKSKYAVNESYSVWVSKFSYRCARFVGENYVGLEVARYDLPDGGFDALNISGDINEALKLEKYMSDTDKIIELLKN